MPEYINREALITEYDRVHIGEAGGARKLMVEAPACDVVEVVHAYWIPRGNDAMCDCSNCGASDGDWAVEDNYYCYNCGAKMDGERRSE